MKVKCSTCGKYGYLEDDQPDKASEYFKKKYNEDIQPNEIGIVGVCPFCYALTIYKNGEMKNMTPEIWQALGESKQKELKAYIKYKKARDQAASIVNDYVKKYRTLDEFKNFTDKQPTAAEFIDWFEKKLEQMVDEITKK